jgi:2-haloacid dehalogenase
MTSPPLIVFDVNETLSDMSPLAQRFADLGLPPQTAALWFASLLRDGFALTAAGNRASFPDLAAESLRVLFAGTRPDDGIEPAVQHVLTGMAELRLHEDVVEGVRALKDEGARLVTLSNGPAGTAERLFTEAGIRDAFDALLSVQDAAAWKPARAAYEYASAVSGVPLPEMLLVAVHPWDIHGAANAGLRTAWLNRSGTVYPAYFSLPTYTITALAELAVHLPPAR